MQAAGARAEQSAEQPDHKEDDGFNTRKTYRTELLAQLVRAFAFNQQAVADQLGVKFAKLFSDFDKFNGWDIAFDEASMPAIEQAYLNGFPSFATKIKEIVPEKYHSIVQHVGALYSMAYVLDMLDGCAHLRAQAEVYRVQRSRNEKQLVQEIKTATEKFADVKQYVRSFRNIATNKMGADLSILQNQVEGLMIPETKGSEEKTTLQKFDADCELFSVAGNRFVKECKNALVTYEEKLVELNVALKEFSRSKYCEQAMTTTRDALIHEFNLLNTKLSEVKLPQIPEDFFALSDAVDKALQRTTSAIQAFQDEEAKTISKRVTEFKTQQTFSFPERPHRILSCYLPCSQLEDEALVFEKHKQKINQILDDVYGQIQTVTPSIGVRIQKSVQTSLDEKDLKGAVTSLIKSAGDGIKSVAESVANGQVKAQFSKTSLGEFAKYLDETFFPQYWRQVKADCWQKRVVASMQGVFDALKLDTKTMDAAQLKISEFYSNLDASISDSPPVKVEEKQETTAAADIMRSKIDELKAHISIAYTAYNTQIAAKKQAVLVQCQKMRDQVETNRKAWIASINDIVQALRDPLNSPKKVVDHLKQQRTKKQKTAAKQLAPLQTTVAEMLPVNSTFKLPSAKRFFLGSAMSGAFALGCAVAGVCFILSNPAGWIAGLAAATLLFCAIAIKCGWVANERRQVNNLLKDRRPENQKRLYDQYNQLKAQGLAKKTRHFMLQRQIVMTKETQVSVDAQLNAMTQGAMRCTVLDNTTVPIYYSQNENNFFLAYRKNTRADVTREVVDDKTFEQHVANFKSK